MAPSSAARSPIMINAARGTQPLRKSLWIPALFVGLMLLRASVRPRRNRNR